MSKITIKEQSRREGAAWAIKRVKELGLEEAEKEFSYRGITGTPMSVDKKELEDFQRRVKLTTSEMISICACMVLRDEFEFGEKRIRRFIRRFNNKVECLEEKYATWDDYRQILMDELGIDVLKGEE